MITLLEHRLRHDAIDYRFTVRFDDEAIMDNKGKIRLLAETKKQGDDGWTSLEVDFEYDPEKNQIELSSEGKHLGYIKLDELPDNLMSRLQDAPDGDDFDTESEIENIESLLDTGEIGAQLTEKIVERFPTDPIIGCLIKGAASTILGQLIRCWYPVRETRPYSELLHQIRECLQGTAFRMLGTFIWRTGWCAARMGL